jgi:CBS domain-containing protein
MTPHTSYLIPENAIIVIQDGKPAGIFTERHLLSIFLVWGKSLDTSVGLASTSHLKTAPTGISIHEAAKITAAQHVRRLSLIKKKLLAGIIAARHLVEACAT